MPPGFGPGHALVNIQLPLVSRGCRSRRQAPRSCCRSFIPAAGHAADAVPCQPGHWDIEAAVSVSGVAVRRTRTPEPRAPPSPGVEALVVVALLADADGDGVSDVARQLPGGCQRQPGRRRRRRHRRCRDPDHDNDGVSDVLDNCPLVANPTQADNDCDVLATPAIRTMTTTACPTTPIRARWWPERRPETNCRSSTWSRLSSGDPADSGGMPGPADSAVGDAEGHDGRRHYRARLKSLVIDSLSANATLFATGWHDDCTRRPAGRTSTSMSGPTCS